MNKPVERLALCTIVHPGVETYLGAWYESVRVQTDQGFDLWIGLDGMDARDAIRAIGTDPHATWVRTVRGYAPAVIRQEVFEQLVPRHPAVIFVDSDDLLDPTRVAAARRDVARADVCGCSMRLIGERGEDLGLVFEPPDQPTQLRALLPTQNMFGLSNTVYRTSTLRDCLPIPPACVLVDWFLVTRAWALGARLTFDYACRMAYRQYPRNTVRVVPPFSAQDIAVATERVLEHYRLVLGNAPEFRQEYRHMLQAAQQRAEAFLEIVVKSPERLAQYVQALNRLPPRHLWWSCVAHPELDELWRTRKNSVLVIG